MLRLVDQEGREISRCAIGQIVVSFAWHCSRDFAL